MAWILILIVLLPGLAWADCNPPCSDGYVCQKTETGKYWCVAEIPKCKAEDYRKESCKDGQCHKVTKATKYF